MKIAIDITPLKKERALQHRVRGTGFYIENLRKALESYFPENKYTYFTRGEKLPKNIELVHYPYFEPFFLTLPLRKIAPTIVTVHDLIPLVFPKYFPAGIKGQIKWQIQKFSLKGSQAIITDSENSKKDIARFTGFPEDKIYVVYLAPAPEFKKMEVKQKYHLPDNFILYVGDATWNKNLPRLIEAIKIINVPLVMVGKALADENFDRSNPWNQDLVKIQAACQADKRIIRLGFVPQEDLVGLYNLAAVFAMPSLYEGFGLPVLEAMACGCPVVTSNVSSIPEVAGQAAIFVDPYDSKSITDGIFKVLNYYTKDREKYRELQEAGFVQAKKFSWEKTGRETFAVYKKVLGQKK